MALVNYLRPHAKVVKGIGRAVFWVALGLSLTLPRSATAAEAITKERVEQLELRPYVGIFPIKARTPYPGPADVQSVGEGTLPERIAMVFGVDTYRGNALSVLPLNNAEKDAADLSSELRFAGFKGSPVVGSKYPDKLLTRNRFFNELSAQLSTAAESAKRVGRPPILLFYFAGHGLNYNGIDYILPADFDPIYAEDIPKMAISLAEIKERLEWIDSALYIIISDACRNELNLKLGRRTGDDVRVNLVPGGSISSLQLSDRLSRTEPSRTRDSVIAYSTLGGAKALDNDGTGSNGAFASELIAALKAARADAEKDESDGSRSSLADILLMAGQGLNGNFKQRLETRHVSSRFLLFPTARGYLKESQAWEEVDVAVRRYLSLGNSLSRGGSAARNVSQAIYCFYKSYLSTVSYYDYFGYAAHKTVEKERDAGYNCNRVETSTPKISQRDGRQNRLRAAYASFRPGALAQVASTANFDRASITVAEAQSIAQLSSEAKAQLRLLRPELPVAGIGVLASAARIYATAALTGAPLASLADGELIELLENGSEPVAASRAARIRHRNVVGFVDPRSVSSGRVGLAFSGKMEGGKPVYDAALLSRLLSGGIVGDAVIHFRSSDSRVGFDAAKALADELIAKLSPISEAGLVIPKLAPLDDAAAVEVLRDADFKVALTLLPLEQLLRQRAASISGASVRAADVPDISQILSRRVIGSLSDQASPECGAAFGSASASFGARPAVAYVQYKGSASTPRSEAVRQLLRSARFSTPPGEDVEVTPRTDEIRVCRDMRAAPAEAARAVLNACLGTDFKLQQIGPCARLSRGQDRFEVWLGTASRADQAPTEELPRFFALPERRIASDKLIEAHARGESGVVEGVLKAIIPSGAESYRVNIYVARTLAGIRGGWSGTSDQLEQVRQLKNSQNYSADVTFRRNVDDALRNHRAR